MKRCERFLFAHGFTPLIFPSRYPITGGFLLSVENNTITYTYFPDV
nr:MAG TPA: hypothetical protein [Caudoviricetes sp.]